MGLKNWLIFLTILVSSSIVNAQTNIKAVRNGIPQPRDEILVLRKHQLRLNGHRAFYEASRDNVWPYFERIGARVVGQWKVMETEHPAAPQTEYVYRLVRYASLEHWKATRPQGAIGGDGPAADQDKVGRDARAAIEINSPGAYFLTGAMAQGGPYFTPALDEKYELVNTQNQNQSPSLEIPYRMDVAQPGEEIVVMTLQRIKKNSFAEFTKLTSHDIWPWQEKLGARPIGQWQVTYPMQAGGDNDARGVRLLSGASDEYDEVITLVRYASRAHLDAMSPALAVKMGGNGPDWSAWQDALKRQQALTISTKTEIMLGDLYQSPPRFLPGTAEQFRRLP